VDRQKLKEELIRDEGMRLQSYKDSVGLWTIGVGHLLGQTERMTVITPSECDALLDYDINVACRLACLLAPGVFNNFDDIDMEMKENAIVNMAFNLGSRLGGFKNFLAAVNSHDWKKAAEEMMDSKWAKQVGKRAERLRDMIFTEV